MHGIDLIKEPMSNRIVKKIVNQFNQTVFQISNDRFKYGDSFWRDHYDGLPTFRDDDYSYTFEVVLRELCCFKKDVYESKNKDTDIQIDLHNKILIEAGLMEMSKIIKPLNPKRKLRKKRPQRTEE
jgi:hypothetical protein